MRRGFTLIEMMVSIVILTILMLFLYKSYGELNRFNTLLESESSKIEQLERIKKRIFLDITLAQSILLQNSSPQEDVVFLQTKESLYRRINPYISYFVKEGYLYRIESLKELKEYPFGAESEFVGEKIAQVESFRIYPSKTEGSALYLVHIKLKEQEEILLKVKALNLL